MAIITVIMVAVLVAVLIISFTIEQQKDSEAKECDFSTLNITERDLELSQSSCESEILETHSQLNLPSAAQNLEELFVTGFPARQMEVLRGSYLVSFLAKTTAERQLAAMTLSSLSFQIAPLQSLRADSGTEILKIGLKIACLVISVSTTGIVSFLVGFSGSNNQSSTRNNKILFKAVILSMCASLFSALILLIISIINLNFSWLILTVRIIIVISTALMTLGVILVIAFYLHVA